MGLLNHDAPVPHAMISTLIRSLIRRTESGLRPGRITCASLSIALALGALGLPLLLRADPQMRDGFGQIYGHDFALFWSAGRAAIETAPEAPWQRAAFVATIDRHYPDRTADAEYLRFNYPPVILLALDPLARLPVTWAFPLMMAAGFALLSAGLWRIIPSPRTLLWTIGTPLLWQVLAYGQWSFWFAGFLAFALLPVARGNAPTPWASAAFILKPPLALALPLAWWGAPDGLRRALQTSFIGAAWVTISIIIWGVEPWRAFFAAFADSQRFLLGGLDTLLSHSTTFGAMVQFYGVPAASARTAQACFTLATLLVTLLVMRSDARGDLKAATLGAGCALGSPYFMLYDLALLLPAAVFYIRDAQAHGFRDGDKLFLLLCTILPLIARSVQEASGLPLGFLMTLAFFIFVVSRARHSAAENQRSA